MLNSVQFEELTRRILGTLHRAFGWSAQNDQRVFAYQPDDYPITGSATAGANVRSAFTVSLEADFVWTKSCGHILTSYSSSFEVRDVQIQVTARGSDKQMFFDDDGAHFINSWGTAVDPFILPKPQYMEAGTSVSIKVTSITANAREIYLDFWGFKVAGIDATTV